MNRIKDSKKIHKTAWLSTIVVKPKHCKLLFWNQDFATAFLKPHQKTWSKYRFWVSEFVLLSKVLLKHKTKRLKIIIEQKLSVSLKHPYQALTDDKFELYDWRYEKGFTF